jgi:outer membrane receptor protein involved in Fe transport
MKRYRSNTRWTSGLSFSRNRVTSSLYNDHAGSNIAFYSQLDAKIWRKIQLSSGVRWEANALDGEIFYSLPVFRAGLNFQPWTSTFLRASLGQGFRFPSVAEKYTNTDIGGLKIFPNPDLDPERGWSAELGVRQGISLGSFDGFADLALFWTEYHDMIEFTFGVYPPNPDDVPTLDDVGFKALNIGRARISGIDLSLSLSKEAGPVELAFSGGYTFMIPVDPTLLDSVEVVEADGQILKYRRRHLLKLDLETGFWKIFAGVSFQYNSRMINVDEVFLDPLTGNLLLPGFPDYWKEHGRGYALTDLRLGWNITEWIRLTAILNNTFNVEYLGRPGDIGQPRNMALQLRLIL